MKTLPLLLVPLLAGGVRVDEDADADPELSPMVQAAAEAQKEAKRDLDVAMARKAKAEAAANEMSTQVKKAEKEAEQFYAKRADDETTAKALRSDAEKYKITGDTSERTAAIARKRALEAKSEEADAQRTLKLLEEKLKANNTQAGRESLKEEMDEQQKILMTSQAEQEDQKLSAKTEGDLAKKVLEDADRKLTDADAKTAESIKDEKDGDSASWLAAHAQVKASSELIEGMNKEVQVKRAETHLAEAQHMNVEAERVAQGDLVDRLLERQTRLAQEAQHEGEAEATALRKGDKTLAEQQKEKKEQFDSMVHALDVERSEASAKEKKAAEDARLLEGTAVAKMQDEAKAVKALEKKEQLEMKQRQDSLDKIIDLSSSATRSAVNEEETLSDDKKYLGKELAEANKDVEKAKVETADGNDMVLESHESMDNAIQQETDVAEKGDDDPETDQEALNQKNKAETKLKAAEAARKSGEEHTREAQQQYNKYYKEDEKMSILQDLALGTIKKQAEEEVKTKEWAGKASAEQMQHTLLEVKNEAKSTEAEYMIAAETVQHAAAQMAVARKALDRLKLKDQTISKEIAKAQEKQSGAKASKNAGEEAAATVEIENAQKDQAMNKIMLERTETKLQKEAEIEAKKKQAEQYKSELANVAEVALKDATDQEERLRRGQNKILVEAAQELQDSTKKFLPGLYAAKKVAAKELEDNEDSQAQVEGALAKTHNKLKKLTKAALASQTQLNLQELQYARSEKKAQEEQLANLKEGERRLQKKADDTSLKFSAGMGDFKKALESTLSKKAEVTEQSVHEEKEAAEQAHEELESAKKSTKDLNKQALDMALDQLKDEGRQQEGKAEASYAEEQLKTLQDPHARKAAKEEKSEAEHQANKAEDDAILLGAHIKVLEKKAEAQAKQQGEASVKEETAVMAKKHSERLLAIYKASKEDDQKSTLRAVAAELDAKAKNDPNEMNETADEGMDVQNQTILKNFDELNSSSA